MTFEKELSRVIDKVVLYGVLIIIAWQILSFVFDWVRAMIGI